MNGAEGAKCGECQHFPHNGISWQYCAIAKRDVTKGCKACKLNFKRRGSE